MTPVRGAQVEELEAAFQVLVFEKPGRSGQRSARMRIQPRGETPPPCHRPPSLMPLSSSAIADGAMCRLNAAIRELMSRLDLNGDGRLDFNEFATFAAMIPSSDLEYLTPYWRTSAMDCGTGNVYAARALMLAIIQCRPAHTGPLQECILYMFSIYCHPLNLRSFIANRCLLICYHGKLMQKTQALHII